MSDAAAWFAGHGVAYLDGSIMPLPDAVGSGECQVLVSGDPDAFDQCSPLFDAIGGDIRFLGSDPTASAVINSSGLTGLLDEARRTFEAAIAADRGVNLAAIFEELRPKST